MSVVINDFEIIPGSSDDGRTEEAEASSAPEATSPRRGDVVEMIEREKRKRRRLRAH